MPFTAPQLYAKFEGVISNMQDLDKMMADLEADQRNGLDKKRVFAYRGVANANHPFFSSLYRRVWWTNAARAGGTTRTQAPPDEDVLAEAEDRVLTELHHWGLHDAERGRLSILRQLAVLQHNHAPARLIDVSLNIWVALWFAVELRWAKGVPLPDTKDGRLFAIDITDRLINESDKLRDWEDDLHRPWNKPPTDWTKRTFAWQPSPADRRIAAQQGAFLFGGVPTSGQYRKSTAKNDWLSLDELRRCTSLPLKFHKTGPGRGARPDRPTYTYRIAAPLKNEIRSRLIDLLGLSAGRIYPDLAGFGKFGTPWLDDKEPQPEDMS
jgi:FRG domain